MTTTTQRATVLADFQRAVRDEPKYYIYKHQVWVVAENVEAEEVHKWLKERYIKHKQGHRYRVVQYLDQSGRRYVDHVLLETLTDADLMFMKLRWGFSKEPVVRTKRAKRRRLTKEQRERRQALLDQFYASL